MSRQGRQTAEPPARKAAEEIKQKPARRRLKPGFKRAAVVVIPAALLLCMGVLFWRPLFIGLFGAPKYYALVEVGQSRSSAAGLAGLLTAKTEFPQNLALSAQLSLGGDGNPYLSPLGSSGSQAASLLADSTFDIRLSRDTQNRALLSTIGWKYKGTPLTDGKAFCSKDQFVLNFSGLLEESLYLKSGDSAAAGNLLGLSDLLAAQAPAKADPAAMRSGLEAVLTKAAGAVGKKNVTVRQNVTVSVGEERLRCDKITVRLSPDELKALLGSLTDAADKNGLLPVLTEKYGIYAGLARTLFGLSGDLAPGGAFSSGTFTTQSLKQAVAGLHTGLTMTVYAQNGLFRSKVCLREFATDSGGRLSVWRKGAGGGFSFASPAQGGTAGRTVSAAYTVSAQMVAGTYSAAEPAGTHSGSFQIDTAQKTAVGLPQIRLNDESGKDAGKKETAFSIKRNGSNADMTLTVTSGGQTLLSAAVSVSAAADGVKDVTPEIENGIDLVTQAGQLDGLYLELGNGLLKASETKGFQFPFAQ